MCSYLCTLTTCHCPHSPTAAAAIDRYLMPPAHSSKPAVAACGGRRPDGTDKQSDGQTDARQLHRPFSTYYAGSANKKILFVFLKKHRLTNIKSSISKYGANLQETTNVITTFCLMINNLDVVFHRKSMLFVVRNE